MKTYLRVSVFVALSGDGRGDSDMGVPAIGAACDRD
jgi:hypothetical protein